MGVLLNVPCHIYVLIFLPFHSWYKMLKQPCSGLPYNVKHWQRKTFGELATSEMKQKLGHLLQCGGPGVKLRQISANQGDQGDQGANVETTCKTLNQDYFHSAKNSHSPIMVRHGHL